VGIVGLVSLARADAPADQYANFQATAHVIYDQRTSLYWQRFVASLDAGPATVRWTATFGVCSRLPPQDGISGWRVPSYKELLTLVDESPHGEYQDGQFVGHAMDPGAFLGEPVDYPYWSSSSVPPSVQTGENAYAVNFVTGAGEIQPGFSPYYVRCVHDGP
jgi:hypothetical protein